MASPPGIFFQAKTAGAIHSLIGGMRQSASAQVNSASARHARFAPRHDCLSKPAPSNSFVLPPHFPLLFSHLFSLQTWRSSITPLATSESPIGIHLSLLFLSFRPFTISPILPSI